MKRLSIFSELQTIRQLLQKQLLLQKEVLTLGEAAAYLDLTPGQLYNLLSIGQIAYFTPVGQKIYVKRSDLDSWLISEPGLTDEQIDDRIDDPDYIKGGHAI